jgi:uncharacterized protein YmfQ (DUF2313 family)
MNHAELLKISLPPVSYDPKAPNIAAELEAEGKALDAVLENARIAREAIVPNAGPMLEDWERVLGLPSPCAAGLGLTRDQRLKYVKAKINEGGTFTRAKAIAMAAELGYTIVIEEHRAREYGRALCGGRYGGRDWNFVWDVITTNNTIFPRRIGSARYGERYRSWGNEILECVLRPKAMSGTLVRFIYL